MKKALVNIINFTFIFLFSVSITARSEIKVVTSIKPIHSLASYLMQGIGSPSLIVEGSNSPHNFTLKPSHAKMLQQADLVFWVGENLETPLEKPIKSISKKSKVIELLEINGLKKLEFREKNIYDGHDDHGHKKKDDHGHAHGDHDPHIWLDPSNAKVIAKKMTKELVSLDKENAKIYKENSKKLIKEIDLLIKDIKNNTNKNASFIVFHDAYQYFEKKFRVNAIGALTVNTDILPGAEQLKDIRNVINKKKAKCIFSEPQFNPNIINTIAKDTNIKTGVLDPLGSTLPADKNQYFMLIKNISNSLKPC
tara:strand:+ start:164 stop:1090 length:927 start_codon:yes stop_codon:yes gene_type:complete